jgi:protein-S-isoprenylcysteine O-methyltransferase Ste14
MYFAMNLMDAVWPLLIGTWWGLVVLIPVFLILHSGVVLREEAYLERSLAIPIIPTSRRFIAISDGLWT